MLEHHVTASHWRKPFCLEQTVVSRRVTSTSLIQSKTIFERSRYRRYRDGDRVRVGLADLHDPENSETPFRIRVVEIERRSKGTLTYIGASTLLDEQQWLVTPQLQRLAAEERETAKQIRSQERLVERSEKRATLCGL